MIAIKGMKMPERCGDCKFCINQKTNDYGSFGECLLQENKKVDRLRVNCLAWSRDDKCPLKQVSDKYKIEQEIREELERLYTYRIPNTKTDLVSLKAVKRILNLVFRGCRDLEPNIADTNPFNDSRFGG